MMILLGPKATTHKFIWGVEDSYLPKAVPTLGLLFLFVSCMNLRSNAPFSMVSKLTRE